MRAALIKMPRYNFVSSIILSVASGVLLSLPFFNGNLWIFSWVGLLPLFFMLEGKSVKGAFIFSYLAGIIFFSCVIYWLIHVTLIGQVLLIAYLSLYFGFFGLFVCFKKESSHLFLLFFLPCVWVVLEFLRGYLFTGFGWALLGYSQYKNLNIIQIADIGGPYIISFIIVMINFLLYAILVKDIKKNVKFCLGLVSVPILLIFSAYGLFRLNNDFLEGKPISVSIIQGNIAQELKWREEVRTYILERYLGLTRLASQDNPQFIIWPESSVPFLLKEDEPLFNDIIDLVRKIKVPLLVGAITAKNAVVYNSAILISSRGIIKEQYEKLHLVPFGEYIPFKKIFGFAQGLASIPIGDFTAGRNYKVFSLDNSNVRFSVLICFEDVFPQLSRAFVNKGANLLVNITNDAWFKETSAPYQHLQASVFRAIENRRFLIRAANTGVSCFISPYGRVVGRIANAQGNDIFVKGYKTRYIRINDTKTLYTRFGDIFVLFCLVFIIAGLVIKRLLLAKKH
jgi:apolipoprotein N-acyltransferase